MSLLSQARDELLDSTAEGIVGGIVVRLLHRGSIGCNHPGSGDEHRTKHDDQGGDEMSTTHKW